MKVLRITMPDGSKWDVPAKLVAANRARFYAEKGDDYEGEFDFAMGDEYTLRDWAAGNMDWSDVEAEARKVSERVLEPVDYQEGWVNGDKEVLEAPGPDDLVAGGLTSPEQQAAFAERVAELVASGVYEPRVVGLFRKKPVVVKATRWFQNGDHPEDNRETFTGEDGKPFLGEGKVVRYYRNPEDRGERLCEHCSRSMHYHGWIDTLEGGHVVCPGDWIITGVKGEVYPCKPEIFDATYEPVEKELPKL